MTKKVKNICIIGCGGFIGSHLVERFLSENTYKIYGIDLSDRKISNLLGHPDFYYLNKNIHEIDQIQPLINKSDCVISLVALCNPSLYNTKPLEVIDVDFIKHLKIVKLCSDLKKWLIHFSTCEVYGKTISWFLENKSEKANPQYYLLKEDKSPLIMGPIQAQRWSYACAKQLLERIIYAYDFECGLDYTIIRPFNFIGPRMDYIPGVDGKGIPRVLACFMEALLFNKPLKLVDQGISKRCFTYIDDAVDAVNLMIENPDKAKGEIFNIGNPSNDISIKELADLMIDIYKKIKPGIEKTDFNIKEVSSYDFYGKGYEDSDRRVPDISKAMNLLGWRPKTDLNTTLEKTMDYYIKEYK